MQVRVDADLAEDYAQEARLRSLEQGRTVSSAEVARAELERGRQRFNVKRRAQASNAKARAAKVKR